MTWWGAGILADYFRSARGGYLCPGKSNGTAILTEYAELCKNRH